MGILLATCRASSGIDPGFLHVLTLTQHLDPFHWYSKSCAGMTTMMRFLQAVVLLPVQDHTEVTGHSCKTSVEHVISTSYLIRVSTTTSDHFSKSMADFGAKLAIMLPGVMRTSRRSGDDALQSCFETTANAARSASGHIGLNLAAPCCQLLIRHPSCRLSGLKARLRLRHVCPNICKAFFFSRLRAVLECTDMVGHHTDKAVGSCKRDALHFSR